MRSGHKAEEVRAYNSALCTHTFPRQGDGSGHKEGEVRAYNPSVWKTHGRRGTSLQFYHVPHSSAASGNGHKKEEVRAYNSSVWKQQGEEVRAYNSPCTHSQISGSGSHERRGTSLQFLHGRRPQILASQSKSGHKEEEVRAYNSFR